MLCGVLLQEDIRQWLTNENNSLESFAVLCSAVDYEPGIAADFLRSPSIILPVCSSHEMRASNHSRAARNQARVGLRLVWQAVEFHAESLPFRARIENVFPTNNPSIGGGVS